jgi:signal transduction histidine kinase
MTDSSVTEAMTRGWWARVVLLWHAAYFLLVAAVGAVLAQHHAPRYAWAVLAAMVLAYVGLGMPALRAQARRHRGQLYLVVAYLGTGTLIAVEPRTMFLVYMLYPQTFAFVEPFFAAFAVVVSMAAAAEALSGDDLLGIAISVVVTAGYSLFFGKFIDLVLQESERRGKLIAELEETRAELTRAHHEAGVRAERERLAREIHDTLAQGFTSLLMLVQAADTAVDKDPAQARQRLALAERTARDNLAEARSLVGALAPADLQTAPLDTAIERITRRTGDELGIAAEVTVTGTARPLDANTQVVLLRAAQEALNNVRRHAAATTIHTRLAYRQEGVLLEVTDDGAGFDPGQASGFGLRGMRSRVEQVSGQLEIASAPGAGTTVRVEVP